MLGCMYVTYIPLTPQLALPIMLIMPLGLYPALPIIHSLQQSMLAYLEQWSSAEQQGDKLYTAHKSARNPS